jgi:short-subunit dehydrogenase
MARKDPPNVREKTVAITGGARGIGRATATEFATAGAKVAIGDLDVELAEKAAFEIGNATGAQVVGLPLDVTRQPSFEQFVDDAEAALGPIDVLINNAGIMPTGLFIDEEPSATDRMIDINLRGVITGSRLAARRFADRGSGVIINVASVGGVTGIPGLATYCATKHAVIGFSEALAAEMRNHGVAVTVVLPGVVPTELSAGASWPKWMQRVATVDPEDVAKAMVAAVDRGKFRVPVPGRLGAMLFAMSLTPPRMRRWADRITGTDRAFVTTDAESRERYHRRIFGGEEWLRF